MNEKEWIDRLRQKEQDYVEPAPEGLWDDIDKGLPDVSSYQKPKVISFWYRIGGIAASVALLIGLGGLFLFLNDEQQPVIISDGNLAEKVDNRSVINRQKPVNSASTNLLAQNISTLAQNSSPIVSENSMKVTDIPTTIEEKHETISTDSVTETTPSRNEEKNNTETVKSGYSNSHYPTASSRDIIIPKRNNTISLTAYAGNMMVNSNSVQSGYGPIVGEFIPGDGDLSNIPEGSDPAADILVGNQDEDVETKTSHKLPIRFGVNVNIPVYDRLGIETGITYSILHSNTTSGSKSNLFDTRQTLHYIGIPLKATYEIWNHRSFSLYAAAGGMVEKCVHGRSTTDFIIGNEVASSETENVKERRLQFSVNAGLGIKWNITDQINLFAEPGVSYYFNNHSGVENSYKDKPFNFDLKIGLRFNINP